MLDDIERRLTAVPMDAVTAGCAHELRYLLRIARAAERFLHEEAEAVAPYERVVEAAREWRMAKTNILPLSSVGGPDTHRRLADTEGKLIRALDEAERE